MNQVLSIETGGYFIIEYRDLTRPLEGVDRFIPIRSDERTVFTCFLEWQNTPDIQKDGSGGKIKVYDLVHVKKGIGAWELCSSWYTKLGITKECCVKFAIEQGFEIENHVQLESGMILITFFKPM